MRRRRYVTEISVLIALGLAAGASRASAETGEPGAQVVRLTYQADGAGGHAFDWLTDANVEADECQARVLLDCIGVPTVQRLDTIGGAPAVESEADAADETEPASDSQALRQLIERSLSSPAEPALPEDDGNDAPVVAETPAIPTTAEQLIALQAAVDAAGFGDQLEVTTDTSGEGLEIIWPAGAPAP